MADQADVIIIGAGPAGLSCAMHLAKEGVRVLVLEEKTTLTGKICGDGISSLGVYLLEKMGIPRGELLQAGGVRIDHNVTYNMANREIRHYRYVQGSCYADCSIGLSRDLLDTFLAKKAEDAGAVLQLGTRVKHVVKDPGGAGYTVDGRYHARHVVFACGVRGAIAMGILPPLPEPYRLCAGISERIVGHSIFAPDSFYFLQHPAFGEGYAWLFPCGEHLWNFGVWSADHQRDLRALFGTCRDIVCGQYFTSCRGARRPGGAIIGAMPPLPQGITLPVNRDAIGDAGLYAQWRNGEGISSALWSGMKKAERILHPERDISLSLPPLPEKFPESFPENLPQKQVPVPDFVPGDPFCSPA